MNIPDRCGFRLSDFGFIPIGLALVSLAALFPGCRLGPDPVRPATQVDEASYTRGAIPDSSRAVDAAHWWRRFNDPAMNALVQSALVENFDIRIAASRVMESHALLRAARGARWPQFSAGLGADRTKFSFVLPGAGRKAIYSTTYSGDLKVNYQTDLFGKLSRTEQAAWSDLLAGEFDRIALVHSVVANVVRSRARIAEFDRKLEAARSTVSSWEQTLMMIERRYRNGIATPLDLRLARQNAAEAKARIPDLERSRESAIHALDVLTGRRPGASGIPADTFSVVPDLEPVPAGLPAELLDRRPDIRGAEMRLHAAVSRVGVAMADLFPSVALTASTGIRSDDLKGLTSVEGLVYSLIANAAVPVFAGGTLRAQVDAAKARSQAALENYSKTVLTALREVEDALASEEKIRAKLVESQMSAAQAQAAYRLAMERYKNGLENLLLVLETERRLWLARSDMIETQFALWDARIDLFLALGGDWGIYGARHDNENN